MSLVLRELRQEDEGVFLTSYGLFKDMELSWYSFLWNPGMPHKEHLKLLKDQKDKSKIPANRVPSTMLYAFLDDKIIGRLSIRHELNDHLLERGGHVGYAVAPAYRRIGHAKEIYRQGLTYCRNILELDKILVTCSDQNIASIKVIESFDHSLENKFFDKEENVYVRRYWVNLVVI